jgi:2-iminoacetate synthase ThiH
LYRDGGARPGADRDEHFRVHALARVLLHGAIPNIQVSWVKLGFRMALACFATGANDFSGTLMEESISKAAGATFGESVAPEELRAMIRSIGRSPAERTTTYKVRRAFNGADEGACGIPGRLQMVESETHTPFREGSY